MSRLRSLFQLLKGSPRPALVSLPAPSTAPLRGARPAPLALEPRLIFDADGDKGVAAPDGGHDGLLPDTATVAAIGEANTSPREIVFVDTAVKDWQVLVQNLRADTQVVLIDPTIDGLSQVQQALAGMREVAALHLITHGSEGALVLGATTLTADTLPGHGEALASIGQALSSDADILLYGCDIGAGAAGLSLIGTLAERTGADIAASTDLTGTASVGGDWVLERSTGTIEAERALTETGIAAYNHWLNTVALNGSAGWIPIMMGVNQDPQGDSQAGAADTDIVGDAVHGSLYTAFDSAGTGSTADDTLVFRLRIDNPTNTSTFGGVAIVGMDANGDGRIDLFISVDGRNNTQAVRLLDPGTGANISPSTTSTSPLPTGWLPNNGTYAFSSANYSVTAVSAATDSNWNGDADLGNDGKTDAFVSWRIPIADIAAVLAKASPTDRNGVVGPRGSGIPGFTKDTVVQYVAFTQTQPGPINGDLNGVGASYDKNASFASLGAFTAPMAASAPVAAGPSVAISEPIGDGILNSVEDDGVTISGTSQNLANQTLSLSVTDGSVTVTGSALIASNGSWTVSGLNLSGLADGTLTVSVTVDPDGNPSTDNAVSDTAVVLHDLTPPLVAIDQLATAPSGTPTLSGTTDLPDGSILRIEIDTDNAPLTAGLVYEVLVASGAWTLNTAAVAPVSGSIPSGGLRSYSKITATAVDAAGNSSTAVALNRPTVTALSTNDTTPVLSGTWTQTAGDVLSVTISGATYHLSPTGNTWSLDLGTAVPSSGSLAALTPGSTYEVAVTVTRGGTSVSDSTSLELSLTTTAVPAIDISGGASRLETDTTPVITGTSANSGGFVIVRLDPGNDGDLSDAVTYSVTPDGSGNWTLDTGSAAPISGTVPSGGFIGSVAVHATDSTGVVADHQVLTISTPTISIQSILSTATTNAFAQVLNTSGGAAYLNMTEDNAVTIAGTAAVGFTVDIVVSDAWGNSLEYNGVVVDGSGNWSLTGRDLSALDDGILTVKATLSGTSVHVTNTSVTHDKTAPLIYITAQDPLKKTDANVTGRTNLAAGTVLTVEILEGATQKALWTNITVDANGYFSTEPSTLTSGSRNVGNGGPFTVKVRPTTTATDAARNIAQEATDTIAGTPNASANKIRINTIAGDNLITAGEIGSGVVISGTTSLTTTGTVALAVTDGYTTVTKSPTFSGGLWSLTLSTAEVQSLRNGPLSVTASVTDSTVAISDVAFATLSLGTPVLTITDDIPGSTSGEVVFTFTFSEPVTGFTASDITVSNGTKGTFSGSGASYTLVVTPTANASGEITVSVASGAATGATTGRASGDAVATQAFNTTPAAAAPTVTIDTSALASDSTPLITGTTSLSPGAPIVIEIDTDNDGATNLVYAAVVQSGGTWSLNLDTATPTAGTLPTEGLSPAARITATATNAYGNSTTAIGLNRPTVTTLLTNDATPLMQGQWTQVSGDTLSIQLNGTTYSLANGNLTVSATGWSLTPAAPLGDGTYEVAATVNRGGSQATDLSSAELVIDTEASVTISGGALTALTGDPTPVISGTSTGLPAGTVLTLSLDTNNDGSIDLVYKTTVSAGGNWSVDTATATPTTGRFPTGGLNGIVPLLATAIDPAGNMGSDTQTLTVDVTGPVIALTTLAKTTDTTPLITGTSDLPAGALITVAVDPDNDGDWSDQHTYVATVQPDGTWSVEATTPLAGIVGIRAFGTDAVGNAATTLFKPLQIVLSAPSLEITTPIASVGIDNVADETEDNTIVIAGRSDGVSQGSTVAVLLTDGTVTITDSALVQVDGTWSLAALNLSGMANGTITVTAYVIDTDGSSYTSLTTFEHAKAGLVVIDSISQDTGALADFVTRDNTVAIFGTATPGASVSVTVIDSTSAAVATFTVTADGNGAWSTLPTSALAVGDYSIQATVGGTTVSQALRIVDATAPTLVTSTPQDDAANVSATQDLTLTFSRTIQAGSGYISLYRSDGSLVENFDVATGAGDQGGSVVFDGATGVTLNPHAALAIGTGYHLKIDATAVIDSAGNRYAGISDSTSLNFTTSIPDTTAPVITGPSGAPGDALATKSIPENTTAVATLTANEAVTWSLVGGADQGKFTINTTTGALSFLTAPDFELPTDADANNSYVVQVRAVDTAGNASTQTLTIAVTDVNEIIPDTTAPVITGPSGAPGDAVATKTVPENATAVTTLTANEAVTWTLVGGADQGKFAIDPTTGALSFLTAPDFELPTDADANNSYVVQVRAVDTAGNASTQTLTIAVTDVNEIVPDTTAPVITGPSGAPGDALATKAIPENTTAVTTLTANEAVTWSLVGGADQGKFAIDTTTGALSFLTAPDFELPTDADANNSYVVQVRAVDTAGNASTQTLTIAVTDVNEIIPDTTAPVITGPSGAPGDAVATKTVPENATAVTTLTANEAVTWSLVGGADQGKFAIDTTTGALSFLTAPDFELPTDADANNSYVVQVRAVDAAGNASTQTLTVSVTDVNEIIPDTTAPVITGPSGAPGDALATKSIPENTTAVATLTANEAVTWSLVGGADQGKFTINTTTGALSFLAAPDFELPTDADANNSYVVQVRAVDTAGNASTQTLTVSVTDVNEIIPDTTAPVITGPSGAPGDAVATKTVPENATAVTTLTANEAVTWSLVGGADQGKFAINPTTGALSFLTAPDFELPTDADANNSYVVQVRAVDTAGNASTQTLTIAVTNMNEAPTGANPSPLGATVGSAFGPVVLPPFTDVDGDSLTYTVSLTDGGPLPPWLTFDPETRTLLGTPPAGTPAGNIHLRVGATDGRVTSHTDLVLALSLPSAPESRPDEGLATESAGLANSEPGTDALGNVLRNDRGSALQVVSVRTGDTDRATVVGSGSPTTLTGRYGTLTIAADGGYAYVIDNTLATVESLNTGQTLTERFVYEAMDTSGQRSLSTLTLTVAGRSDAVAPIPAVAVPAPPPSAPPPPPPAPALPPVVAPVPVVTAPLSPTVAEADRAGSGVAAYSLDSYTQATAVPQVAAFQPVILPSESPRLSVYRGVPDQFSEASSVIRFTIPENAFAHSKADSKVMLHATLTDGSPLPSWLTFDRLTGTFQGIPPKDFLGDLRIKVIARDAQGQQAEAVFRFSIGSQATDQAARSGLTRQLRDSAYFAKRSFPLARHAR